MSYLMRKIEKTAKKWYGRSDLFTQAYLVYVSTAVLPLEKNHIGQYKHFYRFICFLKFTLLSICFYCFVAYILDTYLKRHDVEKFTFSLCFTIFFIMSSVRIILSYFRRNNIESTLNAVNNNLYLDHIGKSESDEKIFAVGETRFKKLAKAFCSVYVLGNFFRIICKILDKMTLIPIPFVNTDEGFAYEFLFFWDILALYYLMTVYAFHELVIMGTLIRTQQHYLVLEKNILQIEDVFSETHVSARIHFHKTEAEKLRQNVTYELLKKNVIHHHGILKIIKKINALYQDSCLIIVVGNGSLLVILVFQIMQMKGYTLTFIICQIIYSVGTIVNVAVICYWASEIQEASRAAAVAVFCCPWLRMNTRNRRMVILLQTALWKLPTIRAGPFSFNLKFLISFLRSVYSYIAFMQNINKRNK